MVLQLEFKVCCNWDDEAGVWYVAESNVPGLSAEAPTVEAMQMLLNKRIPELAQLNMPELLELPAPRHVPFDLIVKRHTDLRLAST